MVRVLLSFLLVALAVLPLPARGGPDVEAERATIQAALDALAVSADRLAALADLYLRERRIDDAREAVEAVAEIARREHELSDRLRALPPPPEVAEPTPVPPAPPAAGVAECIDLGLTWLAAHQESDGAWDCDGFMKHDKVTPACDGAGNALYDPGVTGLSLLAFLGSGDTHRHGTYRETVRKGFTYLKQIQDAEGCFGSRTSTHFTYNHAIGALAMAEAYALTASPLFKNSAQSAVDFILMCQNPYLAWRYGIRPQDNDTSVSGWMIMALKSAKVAGLRVDDAGFEGMKAWLEKVTEPEYGRVGYTARGTGPARPQDLMDKYPADLSEALTAVGILCRMLMGEAPGRSEPVRKGLDLLAKCLPSWNEPRGSIDMYYWYFGTLATRLAGEEDWRGFSEALTPIFARQRTEPASFRGSFDPLDPWGQEGGRVYSTAMMTLCAEVVHR
ncbi:MAG: hypothetical protein MUE73_11340 [Planctomycetes bacterium]|nr:hypothetical protein [Planctomycetota bacterium]